MPWPRKDDASPEPPERLTAEGKLHAWRLGSLLEAHGGPCTIEDVGVLGAVALSKADLHMACSALRRGCTIQQLRDIFT